MNSYFILKEPGKKRPTRIKKKISIFFCLQLIRLSVMKYSLIRRPQSKFTVKTFLNCLKFSKFQYFTLQIASSPIRQEVDDDYEDIYQRLGKGWLISESKSKIWTKTNKSNQNQDFNNHKSWKKLLSL